MGLRSHIWSSCEGGGKAHLVIVIHPPRAEVAFVLVYKVSMNIQAPLCCFLATLGTWASPVPPGVLLRALDPSWAP